MMMAETVRQNCILTVPSMVPGMWLVKINSTFFPAMIKRVDSLSKEERPTHVSHPLVARTFESRAFARLYTTAAAKINLIHKFGLY
jgi:hypothetical protein